MLMINRLILNGSTVYSHADVPRTKWLTIFGPEMNKRITDKRSIRC